MRFHYINIRFSIKKLYFYCAFYKNIVILHRQTIKNFIFACKITKNI